MPSPNRLAPITAVEIASAGNNISHGAVCRYWRPSLTIRPQSGSGGWTPMPMKPSDVESRIANDNRIASSTTIGPSAFGSNSRVITQNADSPRTFAASTNSRFFSPSVTGVLIEDSVRQLQARGLTDSYHLLTDREREVLQLLAEGRSNKEVAALLDVGVSTVETHRANLMQKLNLHNTAEIVLYAVRKRIIV